MDRITLAKQTKAFRIGYYSIANLKGMGASNMEAFFNQEMARFNGKKTNQAEQDYIKGMARAKFDLVDRYQ